MQTITVSLTFVVTAALLGSAAPQAEPRPEAQSAPSPADFNGDGFTDLAIGVSGESLGADTAAGAVHAVAGSAEGLTALGSSFWHQDSPGIGGITEDWDEFGSAVTAGDFDGDGFSDLAVGARGEHVGAAYTAGAAHVIYGSPEGLSAEGSRLLSQAPGSIKDAPDPNDWFGWALAAADYNSDGFGDLAIGVPGEGTRSGTIQVGAVHILYGSANGLTGAGDQFWHQNSADVEELAESEDFFGAALAAGDVNGDGFPDLAVGVPREDIDLKPDAGAIHLLYGSAAGLTGTGSQYLHQDSIDVEDQAEPGDYFGSALAMSDLNGDGFADLAIGGCFVFPAAQAICEDVSGQMEAGGVNVLYGSVGGLSTVSDQFWNQDSPDVEDQAERDDAFGWALAAGDLNGDGFGDLAVGVQDEDVGAVSDSGVVSVLYGSAGGLSAVGDQLWHQDITGVEEDVEGGDRFGWSLSFGDHDGDGFGDLAIGVAEETVALSGPNAGAVSVLYGSSGGLTSVDDQLWDQDRLPGDVPESYDSFGQAVTAGPGDSRPAV